MRIPGFISRLFLFLGLSLLLMLAARLAMLVLVWEEVRGLPGGDLAKALYIGAKFDLRMAVFACLPLALALGLPWLERRLDRLRPWLAGLYGLAMLVLTLVYVIDFGFFFYLRQRVDSTLFELIPDVGISAAMVWESYPVLRIALAVFLTTMLFAWIALRLLRGHQSSVLGWKSRSGWTFGLALALFLMAYAQLSSNLFPLRWSNA